MEQRLSRQSSIYLEAEVSSVGLGLWTILQEEFQIYHFPSNMNRWLSVLSEATVCFV